MLRWWRRSPRLIQSLPRNSSSIAPRMRCVAKVSNITPCAASKRDSASLRPIMPTWIRSSSSTLAGSLAIIWCARRRTSGLYCLIIALASRRPLAVYMGALAPDGSVQVQSRCETVLASASRATPGRRRRARLLPAATAPRPVASAPRRADRARRRPGRWPPSRTARHPGSFRRNWPAARRSSGTRAPAGGAASSRSKLISPQRCASSFIAA